MTGYTNVTELGGDTVSEAQVEHICDRYYSNARRDPNMIGFSRNSTSVESVPPWNALNQRGRTARDPNRRRAW